MKLMLDHANVTYTEVEGTSGTVQVNGRAYEQSREAMCSLG